MDLELKGKIAAVSGSSQGIGRAIAHVLLAEGATVYITGRNADALKKAHEEMSSEFSDSVRSFQGDMADTDTVVRLMDRIGSEAGRLDIAVANVGTGKSKPGWDVEDSLWEESMHANFFSAVSFVRESVRMMLPMKTGSIVAVSSIAALEAIPAPVPYSAAKSALMSYVKNMAGQLGPEGVRINSVVPGNVFFEGGTWDRITKERGEWAKQYIDSEVPMKRFATPEEIADAVCFLCSPRSSFTTGAHLVVDGGQTRRVF